MAYEVIEICLRMCLLKSDILSIEILLWKLFSIGKQPYSEHVKADRYLLKGLKDENFLTCPDELKNIETRSLASLFDECPSSVFILISRKAYLNISEIIHTTTGTLYNICIL